MGAFGKNFGRAGGVDVTPYGLVRDGSGPNLVDKDSTAIMDGLRQELDRIHLTHDTSCICIVSPDGIDAAMAMDELGRRFASKLRSYDAIYRFSDDKYLVMLPHIGREDAISVTKRLRTEVLPEGDHRVRQYPRCRQDPLRRLFPHGSLARADHDGNEGGALPRPRLAQIPLRERETRAQARGLREPAGFPAEWATRVLSRPASAFPSS